MSRKLFLMAGLAVAAFVIGHAASEMGRVTAADKDTKDGNFVHAVVFYLKKDAPKDEPKALVDDAHELLAKIPTVRSIKIGPPSDKGTPKVAVTDYSLGLLVLFDDAKGLHTYLDHPLHLKYVDKHMKHIEKVLVYDFVQGSK